MAGIDPIDSGIASLTNTSNVPKIDVRAELLAVPRSFTTAANVATWNLAGRTIIYIAEYKRFYAKNTADTTSAISESLVRDINGLAFEVTDASAFGGRELLTANRTYYVRPDGNDTTNNGLANTSAGAFLTLPQAFNVVSDTLDLGGHTVTIAIADGTYTDGLNATRRIVGGNLTITGNTTTPGNVIISTTSADAIRADGAGVSLTIEGMELRTTTSGSGVIAENGSNIIVGQKIRFGTCATNHAYALNAGVVRLTSNYDIVGPAGYHYVAAWLGLIDVSATITITITGTPAFAGAFAFARAGLIRAPNKTFSGSATGKRYLVDNNGTIFTNAGGASYFPGDVAGTGGTTTGGGLYN